MMVRVWYSVSCASLFSKSVVMLNDTYYYPCLPNGLTQYEFSLTFWGSCTMISPADKVCGFKDYPYEFLYFWTSCYPHPFCDQLWEKGKFFSGCTCHLSFKIRQSKYLLTVLLVTDYGRPERKYPSLHRRKFNPNPKFLGMAAAYFVCHIGPIFQVSLIYAFIGCP